MEPNTNTPTSGAPTNTSSTPTNNSSTLNPDRPSAAPSEPRPITPSPEPPVNPTPPATPPAKPKKSNASTIIACFCALLAIAGIGASIYFFMDSNNKSADIANLQSKLDQIKAGSDTEIIETEEDDTTIVEPTNQNIIDSAVAQNVIEPYLKSLGYNYTILGNDLSEDAKAILAYLNINPLYNTGNTVSYYSLNDAYQSLFGNNTSIEQRTFSFPQTISLTYNPNTNSFEPGSYAGGGTGASIFSIVKQANLSGDNLTVEVYSDRIGWCSPEYNNNDGYCYDGTQKDSVTLSDGNMSQIIANYGDRIPVYQMDFAKNAGHYVLSNIQKIK